MAVTRLLPESYGPRSPIETDTALNGLAARLVARHGDHWLQDALRTPHSARAAEAFAMLGHAESERETWNFADRGGDARKALSLFQALGQPSTVLFAKFEYIQALDWTDQSRDCVQAAGALRQVLHTKPYPWLDAQTAAEESSCATWMGDLERGEQSGSAALDGAQKANYEVLALRVAGLNASRYAQIGNYAGALRESFNGLTKYWKGNYPPLRAHQFYSNLLLLTRQNRAVYPALAWATQLAAIDANLGNNEIYGPTLWRLGLAELDAGDKAAADRDLAKAARVYASVASDPRMQIDLAVLETANGEHEKALSALLAIKPAAEQRGALMKMEFAAGLGRVEQARGEYEKSKTLLEEARAIGDKSWSRAPKQERLLWARTMGGIYRGLLECEIHGGKDPTHPQARQLWAEYRAHLFARGDAVTPVDTRAAGEARLTFAELPSGLAAWLETDRGLDFRLITPDRQVVDAVGRTARDCASDGTPVDVVRADARELSQRLLGPWDSRLDGARLVSVETDGSVAQVPWLALVRQSGRYWSEDLAIRIRAGEAADPKAAPLTSDSPALFVAAPAFDGQDSLGDLQNARAAAERVSSRFRRSIHLMGKKALLSEVRTQLTQVELFHFGGHGFAADGGGLLLRGSAGGPALLHATDIAGLDLSRCRLVLLAACSTASGERSGPGDPQSLVRGFLQAGVQDVGAGLWDLDSSAMQMLVGKFYDSLLAGLPAAESLRDGANVVRASYPHPYYWAGLEIFSRN